MHLTYIPRKPSPLGVMFKVTCCGETGILLHAELVDGKDVDRLKKYVRDHKPTTACTLRLVEHWQGTGRVVVGDAWFGSVRTVEELLAIGLYSVMNIKNGCAGFPKERIKRLVPNRGDAIFFEANVLFKKGERTVTKPIYAAGHKDKQPLVLCASCGTSLPGEQRVRHRTKLVQGELHKSRYTLDQPQMHAMYRGKFNVVDLFNKASCQPGTLQDTWRTKKVHKRLFAASISWIETNASLAFAKYNPTVTLTKREWYETLSEACLNNPFAPCRPRTMPTPPGHEGITQGGGGCWNTGEGWCLG